MEEITLTPRTINNVFDTLKRRDEAADFRLRHCFDSEERKSVLQELRLNRAGYITTLIQLNFDKSFPELWQEQAQRWERIQGRL